MGLKSANTTYTTDISRPKCVYFSCNQYIISEYPDILAQKNMHQYLILFKNIHDFINFSCLIFQEKRSQYPPICVLLANYMTIPFWILLLRFPLYSLYLVAMNWYTLYYKKLSIFWICCFILFWKRLSMLLI